MNGGARDEERVGRASHDHIELLPVSQQQGGFGAAGLRSRGYEYSDEAAETNEPTDVFTAGQDRRRIIICRILLFLGAIFFAVMTALAVYVEGKRISVHDTTFESASKGFQDISRIAFGSCSAYDAREITIFESGVIPSEPDAWIWVGDMVYMDTAFIDCHVTPDHPDCSCSSSFLGGPPTQCFAGDLDHARDKVTRFVGSPSYQAFVEYMCPGQAARSSIVPEGSSPDHCVRAILGTYDDHDSGWNNGNRRLPDKHEFKNLYLDAIGEARDSPRRSSVQGLEAKVVFNSETPERQIDVFLLDERFLRTPLPCTTRSRYCQGILNGTDGDLFRKERTDMQIAWCEDFLFGGPTGQGSCCRRDDELFGWCQNNLELSTKNATWAEACDPTSEHFGERNLVVRDSQLLIADPDSSSDMAYASQFCEVLGRPQRVWLREGLRSSKAPLKLVASGSVVLGNPGRSNTDADLPSSARAVCSGDDWGCYQLAQQNLIHTLGTVEDGCVVILTGDFHYADIKALQPGPSVPDYRSSSIAKPIYQVMASGLSHSTAPENNSPEDCTGVEYRHDQAGLRVAGSCGMYTGPNFGMVEVNWKKRQATLSVRTYDGSVAQPAEPSLPPLEFVVDLRTCKLV